MDIDFNDKRQNPYNDNEYPNKKISNNLSDSSKNLNINNDTDNYGGGVLLALVAKGAQDVYMTNDPRMFDARIQFLNNIHQFSYQKIITNLSILFTFH